MQFRWYLLILTIAFLGLGIYWTGYNRDQTLDYDSEQSNYVDEIRLYFEAINLDRVPESERELAGYPPGLFFVFRLAHWLSGSWEEIQTVEVLSLTRLWVGMINALSLILLALIGRRLHSPWLGILAMLAWMLAPLVINRVHFALTEAFQVFFNLLAFYAALRVLDSKNAAWAILSIISALIVIIFKYSGFPSLGFGVGAGLYCLLTEREHRKFWLLVLSLQILLIVGWAAGIFLTYPEVHYLMSGGEAARFTGSGGSFVTIEQFIVVFQAAFAQLGWSFWAFLPLFFAGSVLYVRQKPNELRYSWLMLIVFCLASLLMIPFYIIYWVGVQRYTTPSSPAIALLISLNLILVLEAISNGLKTIQPRLALGSVIIILASALWLIPQMTKTYENLRVWGMPQQNISFNHWLKSALAPGTINLPYGWYRVLNPWWGYGDTNRPWISEPIMSRSLEEWQNLHLRYTVLHDRHRHEMLATEEGRIFLDNLLLIKHYPAQAEGDYETGFGIYHLGLPQIITELSFDNQIWLYGYSLSSQSPEAGDTLNIQFFWQSISLPQSDYHVFVHLVAESSPIPIAQTDTLPSLTSYPPSRWSDEEEIIVGENFSLVLPEVMESGHYRVLVGMYHFETGQRLISSEGSDSFEVLQFSISD